MTTRNSPLNRRGVEQILATTPDVTLVVKATSDGKLEVSARCFDETIKILDGERLPGEISEQLHVRAKACVKGAAFGGTLAAKSLMMQWNVLVSHFFLSL